MYNICISRKHGVNVIYESRRLFANTAKCCLAMSSAHQPSGPHQPKEGSKQPQRNITSSPMSPILDRQKAQVCAQVTEGVCVSQPTNMTASLPSRPSLTIGQALSKTKRKALIKAHKAEEREKKQKANEAVGGEAILNSRPFISLDVPASISVSTPPSSHTRSHQARELQVTNKISYRVPGKPYGEKKQEAKISPSAASGGIPKPTIPYIEKAIPAPMPLEGPQHLLVVIDLNGTILYRPSKLQPKKFVQRPHARRFLQYCLDTFTVIIWSSARRENVEGMCQAFLTDELAGKVTAVWGRDKLGLSPADYKQRVQVYKRLTRLWDDPQVKSSHPEFERGGRWDQTNTVLIDDSLEKAKSEPFNLIEVPEYFGDSNEAHNILPQVHDYINWLSCHNNVSSAIRTNPFRATTLEGLPI